MNNILIITATIQPKSDIPNLQRTDPNLRMQDYVKGLEFYLQHIGSLYDKIVFAENSEYDLAPLKAMVTQIQQQEHIEFLQFDGLDYPSKFDRGYGEFKLIQYAMDHSQFITQANDNAIIWKVTGRYLVKNIDKIVKSYPAQADIYGHYRNYPKKWMDTYLLGWRKKTYGLCLDNIYEKLKLNVPGIPQTTAAEELLRAHLEVWDRHINIVKRFKHIPFIIGNRGTDNREYSKDDLWKYRVRKYSNRFLPWLWL